MNKEAVKELKTIFDNASIKIKKLESETNNLLLKNSEQSNQIILREEKILGVIVNDENEITGDAVILATGHSAKDIFYLLGFDIVCLANL